ncbi:hypothetical protein FB45DRAFT_1021924 [Roridomyces roridus]|uniref:F-box domain-containing protein n=1 Tax=Roridomyces roridus TaxID=1738132 RepID=A0AAD7FSL4_9AGAR|nr:hypothetical protein FB45DRAFT_1021924 [Roridomyces roridus]
MSCSDSSYRDRVHHLRSRPASLSPLPATKGLSSPVVLTGVCRRWQRIALSTPSLWRAVPVRIDLGRGVDLEPQIQMLRSWLARPGNCSLSIQVPHGGDYSLHLVRQIFDTILPHRERVEYLDLGLERGYLHALEAAMPLPRLRNLSIGFRRYSTASSRVSLCGVPQLRTASLTNYPYPMDLLPWSQLTSLTLMNMVTKKFIIILRQATNLIHLEIALSGKDVPIQRRVEIQLPKLQSLVIGPAESVLDMPPVGYLLLFNVPTLRTLQVPGTFLGRKPIPPLETFISRSGCSLQRVVLTGELFFHSGIEILKLKRAWTVEEFEDEDISFFLAHVELQGLRDLWIDETNMDAAQMSDMILHPNAHAGGKSKTPSVMWIDIQPSEPDVSYESLLTHLALGWQIPPPSGWRFMRAFVALLHTTREHAQVMLKAAHNVDDKDVLKWSEPIYIQ